MRAASIMCKLRELDVPHHMAKQAAERFGDDAGIPTPSALLEKAIKRAVRMKGVTQHRKEFRAWCNANGIPNPMHEYTFARESLGRKWAFDWCWMDSGMIGGVALEIEGGIYSNGRHVRGKGYEEDMKKYTAAATLGWRLVRTTWARLYTDETLDALRTLLHIADAADDADRTERSDRPRSQTGE